jgi:subtilase family serine protease
VFSAMRGTLIAAGAVLTVSIGVMSAVSAQAGPNPASGAAAGVAPARPACGSVAVGHARCFALYRTGHQAMPGTTAHAARTPAGYWPSDITAAYKLPITQGAGRTVAIVDAYDDPKAESDLAVYRKQFGLPACTTKNGCFRKVNQRGAASPLPDADDGWAGEISLDVDAVSASCPKCKILLVEADSDDVNDLGKSVNMAIHLGAKIVSNSWGAEEWNGITSLGKRYFTHAGVAIVASTGDDGFGPAQFPASWQRTTAAGGTTLKKSGSTWKNTVWNGAGSGCSAYVPKPPWQKDKNCKMRVEGDVSAVADPDTGLAVYNTYGQGTVGWDVYGGTSLAAPLIAGSIGLAGNSNVLGNDAYIYAHASKFTDVVGGSNGSCGGDYLCTGVKGYDGPSGLGTPNGIGGL